MTLKYRQSNDRKLLDIGLLATVGLSSVQSNTLLINGDGLLHKHANELSGIRTGELSEPIQHAFLTRGKGRWHLESMEFQERTEFSIDPEMSVERGIFV